MDPQLDALTAIVRTLASAAHVQMPSVVLRERVPKIAEVHGRHGGVELLVTRQLLVAPSEVVRAAMAHEIGHIAHRDPIVRRRLRVASIAGIWAIAAASVAVSSALLLSGSSVLGAFALVAGIGAMVLPRAVQLAILRHQEYEADRFAAQLLGGPIPVVTYFDWFSAYWRPLRRPLPVRLWMATHPSLTARRRALLDAVAKRESLPS